MMLSKGSSVFYRIPSNGLWGLLEWYPGVKAPKKKAEGDTTDKAATEDKKDEVAPVPAAVVPIPAATAVPEEALRQVPAPRGKAR